MTAADKPGRALEWTPANVVPMTTAPEDAERIAAAALEQAKQFREGMGR